MLSEPSTHWDFNGYQQLQLPHPDHPEDGHTDVVYGVDIQGDHLVSVSADQTARVWDLRTQRCLHPPLVGHTGSVTAVQFDAAADEDVVITGGTDGNVMVWRFSTGELVHTIAEAHDDTVLSLHFDHRYLVTGGRDKKVKLWNRHSLDVDDTNVPQFTARAVEGDAYREYDLLAIFDGHNAAVNAVRLKDNLLVSGAGDSTMCIWSLQPGEMLQKVNIHQRGIACLQFNGRFVVSGSTDNTARIYDVEQRIEAACLRGHTSLIRSIQAIFDAHGEVKTIMSGDYDGSVRIWEQVPSSRDWRTQQQFHLSSFQVQEDVRPDDEEDRFGNRIFSVALDDKRFVCSGQGPIIHVWSPYRSRSNRL